MNSLPFRETRIMREGEVGKGLSERIQNSLVSVIKGLVPKSSDLTNCEIRNLLV